MLNLEDLELIKCALIYKMDSFDLNIDNKSIREMRERRWNDYNDVLNKVHNVLNSVISVRNICAKCGGTGAGQILECPKCCGIGRA